MPSKEISRNLSIVVFALTLLLLISGSRASATPPLDTSYIYDFDLARNTGETTLHCYGEEVVTLHFSTDGIVGQVSSHSTWDEGESWTDIEQEFTYGEDRTYYYQSEWLYTGWWIEPFQQEGSPIYIDGDMPATNQFSRTGPFTVLEMTALTLRGVQYACWKLVFGSPANGQSETFYYETRTGVLVAAYSDLYQSTLEKHMTIEIRSTVAPLPQADPLTLLWISYGTLALSLVASSAVTLVASYLLGVARRRRSKRFTELLEKR